MTKLEYFEIEYDRDDAIYEPGETVSGRVVFSLSGPIDIRELRLKARGEAYVHWQEYNHTNKNARSNHPCTYGGNNHPRTYGHYNYYKSEEHYFTIIEKLDFSEDDGEITLLAGEHSYEFSFQLPYNLPFSFKDECGWVQYTVKAILDRPWRFDDKVTSVFTVIAPYDSSIKEDYAEGILDETGHSFTSYFCLDAGFMNFDVSTRTRGFYPGETIDLTITYDSEATRVKITELELKFEKVTTFITSSKRKSVSRVLEKVYEDGPFCKNDKRVISLDIPSELTPANLRGCSIINVDYKLVLIIHVSGWHSKITYNYAVQIWDTEVLDS